MTTDAEFVAVKNRAAAFLLGIPGVLMVGIGGRARGGRSTGERTIRVFVERKRPPGEIPESELVPAGLEGVGTDVVDLSAVPSDTSRTPCFPIGPQGAGEEPFSKPDEHKWKNLIGGAMVGSDVDPTRPGTIGCFLEHLTDPHKVYLLSNQHVLGEAPPVDNPVLAAPGTKIRHPRPQEDWFVGLFETNRVGVYVGGARNGVVDAAIAQLDPGTRWYADILEIGPITDKYKVTQADVDLHCFQALKRGARTGLTGGTLQGVGCSFVSDGKQYNNLILIQPNPNPGLRTGQLNQFSDHGDSGSIVVDNFNRAIGLLFSGFAKPDPVDKLGWSKLIPIDDVLTYVTGTLNIPVKLGVAKTARQLRVVPS